ncbi:perlucin-like protein [Sitodiplosis mosellana]|uniref:perlucin-like protein n=1 Tax=Sitodiplosis mosellana TaxID=263140 RepID=UPI002443C160|nr:perlucin-like protein [Sitodiplosis mosellana]
MQQSLVFLIYFFSVVSIFSHDVVQRTANYRMKRKPKDYHLYTSRVNWTEAVKQCESKGMELVSILSKEENDNLIGSIKEAGQGKIGFWTSGNRLETNGTFYWFNRSQVTFTDWETGKPDNRVIDGEEEECIEVKGFGVLKWNDNFCSHSLYYICETNN